MENRNENGSRGNALLVTLCVILTAGLLLALFFCVGNPGKQAGTAADARLMDKFDRFVTNSLSDALDGIVTVEKTYWLSDEELVAPVPDPEGYGIVSSSAEMETVLADAAGLLDGQSTLFTPETQIMENSQIHYYRDETILVVTWKQVIDKGVYTFSEVKIAHPSQFRRFLSGGKYGSGVLYTTSEMAASVNAVTASSGDYYSYRHFGIVVNNGQVFRSTGKLIDTCFIDENGDLLFSYAGEINDDAAAQKFADENNVRFSLSFGPVMILDNKVCAPDFYNVGQIKDNYARAALCQMDKLHYVLVTVNQEAPYYNTPSIDTFAQRLQEMGVPTAYALDGGQTAVIVTGNEIINNVNYGHEREVSDIIYFATAIPDEKS